MLSIHYNTRTQVLQLQLAERKTKYLQAQVSELPMSMPPLFLQSRSYAAWEVKMIKETKRSHVGTLLHERDKDAVHIGQQIWKK